MKKKAKTKTRKRPIVKDEIKIDQILLHNRQIFLYGFIDNEKAQDINTKLNALNAYQEAPIVLWINSGGGYITDGFSIIDTLSGITSPVMTIIVGHACSMAGIISICGDKRLMTKNSCWMAHDMAFGVEDYYTKIKDRMKWSAELQQRVCKILREKTKISEEDIQKAINGELWFDAKQALEKNVVDNILK